MLCKLLLPSYLLPLDGKITLFLVSRENSILKDVSNLNSQQGGHHRPDLVGEQRIGNFQNVFWILRHKLTTSP